MSIVYEVVTKLTMINGVSPVLALLGKETLGLEGGIAKITKSLGGMNTALVVSGGLGVTAGAAIVGAFTKLVDKGNDWVKVTRDMQQAGVTNIQNLAAQAEAMKLTAKFANMSSVEILKMQNDARQTFGSQNLATEHIKPFVEAASFLKAYQGIEKGGHNSEALMHEINAAMKSGEVAGKIAPADMDEHIKQLTAMKVAYGDQVKITQYLAAQRTGGVALRNTSDAFRYGMFPALVQEQGSSAGVMLMTAFNKVVAGVGNRTQSIEAMEKLGLLNHDQVKYDKVGRAIGLKDPDAIKGSRDAAINFGDWVMKTLKPLLDKQAGDDPIKQAQLISKMFPDRNAAKAVTEVIQQFTKLTKDAENMARARKAMNTGEYTSGSWDYQVEAFKTQWDNLMTHLGAPAVQRATQMLASLNSVMIDVSQWAMANPENARVAVDILFDVGAALTAFGSVALVAGLASLVGPTGLIIGLTAAFGTLVALNWDGIVSHVKAFGTAMTDANNWESFGTKWLDATKTAFQGFMDDALNPLMALDWGGLIPSLKGLVSGISELAGIAWADFKIAFGGFVNDAIKPLLAIDWAGVVGHIKAFGSEIADLARAGWDILNPGLKAFGSSIAALAGIGWDALTSAMAKVIDFFKSLGAAIGDFFSKMGSWLHKTSFEGGGDLDGATIQKASYGGAASDPETMNRAVGGNRGIGGGENPAVIEAATSDHHASRKRLLGFHAAANDNRGVDLKDAGSATSFKAHYGYQNAVSTRDFYRSLLDRGFSSAAAAGLTGNAIVESGGNLKKIFLNPPTGEPIPGHGTGDAAYGAMQWEGARKHSFGGVQPTLESHARHIYNEIISGTQGLKFKAFNSLSSAAEAARQANLHYERPLHPSASMAQRMRAAEHVLKMYGAEVEIARQAFKKAAPRRALLQSEPNEALRRVAPSKVIQDSDPSSALRRVAPPQALQQAEPNEAFKKFAPRRAIEQDDGGEGPNPELRKFAPPVRRQEQAVHIDTALNIDGETFGRMSSKHLSRHFEHPRQAPYFDGRGLAGTGDMQYAVG